MHHQIQCIIRVYDENSSALLDQFDEMIRRLYSVSDYSEVPNVEVDDRTTVGRAYIVNAGTEKDCHQICCALRCNCPAPFEVMLHRSHWTVEKLGH